MDAGAEISPFAYYCPTHKTTRHAPFVLMMMIPKLHFDLAFSTVLHNLKVVTHNEYVQFFAEAMGIAQASALKQLKRHTEYAKSRKSGPLYVGFFSFLCGRV